MSGDEMIQITHIITGLGSGGAENMLYKLLKYSNPKKYNHQVISLMDEGVYGPKIQKLGIKVYYLKLSKKNILRSLYYSRKIARDSHIINTWLYHSDLFGFILAKILMRKKLIWNIRHSNLDLDANKESTLRIVRLNARLSKFVNLITYNSKKAHETHELAGYLNENQVIIPNGFELDKFYYNPKKREKLRKQLKLGREKVIITVGRWDIQKDYYTLFKALNEVKKKTNKFKLIMAGTNLDNENKELIRLIRKYRLENMVLLLGRRNDIPDLLSASDIYVSSSLGESFSNAIGEAMACELPCIVTDVGDSKTIVGNTGSVVQAKDFKGLARELYRYIENKSLHRNIWARNKVIENYEIIGIVRYIENKYKEIK